MRGEAGERKGKRKDERGGSQGSEIEEDEWGERGKMKDGRGGRRGRW
jgi:hypothetical protein